MPKKRSLPFNPLLNDLLAYFQDLHQRTLLKGLEPSLGRMIRLMESLGNPEKSLPPMIHVAGTNGKGSTIAFMRGLLEACGLRVHTYTSPHLIAITERITLDGQSISEIQLVEYLSYIRIINNDQPLTFFESLTAAAFLAFKDHPADILLLETGIGGRLDATNVISAPVVTIITSLSYDHQEYLGDSLEEIAAEKAGIIKAGSKVVIAPQEHQSLIEKVLLPKIRGVGASLVSLHDPVERFLGIGGAYQPQNARAALTAAQAFLGFRPDEGIVIEGLASAKWPGRLEKVTENPEIWLEGAHNEGGFCQLSGQIDDWRLRDGRPLHVFLAMVLNRDPHIAVAALAGRVDRVYAVDMSPLDSLDQRQQFHSPEKFVKLFSEKEIICEILTFDQMFEKINQNNADFPRNLVTGSLYLVGKVISLFNKSNGGPI